MMKRSTLFLGTSGQHRVKDAVVASRRQALAIRAVFRTFLLQILFLQSSMTFCQLNSPVWVARYDGGGMDEARDIAVSPDGRTVYATGYTQNPNNNFLDNDIITAAYDAISGRQIWRVVHGGPINEEGVSIVVSPDGSRVYVAAVSHNGLNNDYLIIAYDAQSGYVFWMYRHNPYDEDDHPFDMTISPDGRYVYVTGESFVPSQDYNYATIAIRTIDGRLMWQQLYDGPPVASRDRGVAIEISPNGSQVFVAGQIIGIGQVGEDPPPNLSVIAYDADSGEQLWVSVYDLPRSVNGSPFDISIRRSGDLVYVAGFGMDANSGGTTRQNISTACYRVDNGRHAWVTRYDSNTSQGVAYSVVAGWNRVFATGTDGIQRVTIAYGATSGRILWVSTLCKGYGSAISVNGDESAVFVTGSGNYRNSPSTMATAAYDAVTGRQLWAAFYDPVVLGGTGNSIALSPDGRLLFVAGVVDLDFSVVAYKSLPTTLDGDANADGCVDDADLLLVLLNFGQQCCGIPFDLNGDCVVDDSDLLMVLLNFGSGC
jgi:hypothetical protein